MTRRPSPSSHRLPRQSRPTASPPAPFFVTPAYLVPVRPDTPLSPSSRLSTQPQLHCRAGASIAPLLFSSCRRSSCSPDLVRGQTVKGASQPNPAGKASSASPATVAWATSSPQAISPFLFRNNLRISLIMRFCFKNS
jgi:hypothetical protein